MSTHRLIDRICAVAAALSVLLTVLFMNGESLGIRAAENVQGYENRLFDTSIVHTIDIVMDDWDGFIETCTDEEYTLCSVVIDGESYKNVAIRAKGNTSLTQVANYGNDRYSFKIEFDHYDSTKTYYGLDKLSLNNIIQDNTYMKDYLTYQMMGYFGVDAPLCSYVYITVNGEDWGLYLAVEGVEEAFLERNYGSGYGELYKPDSTSMGGGRGNGGRFNIEDWQDDVDMQPDTQTDTQTGGRMQMQRPNFEGGGDEMRSEWQQDAPDMGEMPDVPVGGGMNGGTMGSSDVSLIYTDDEYSSYSNIFDNAKTDITDADRDRLIASLKQLGEGENIEEVVDVDEVIRYFVVHNFVCNFDSYTGTMIHNYYLYEEDGQLSMIPWDYNLAFGGFQGAQDATELVNYPIDTPVSGGSVESRPMLAWIFADEQYTEMYHEYFSEFISTYFESGYFEVMIDNVRELISPYVERDPTKFCTYKEFESGIETLEQFCMLRAESVRGQLNGEIPSTSDGQAEDDSALVEASGIAVDGMGTMNVGGMTRDTAVFGNGEDRGAQGERFSGGGDFGAKTDASASVPNVQTDEETPGDADSGSNVDFGRGTPGGQFSGERPASAGETAGDAASQYGESSTSAEWAAVAASGGMLMCGIVAAALYRKRA